MTKSTPDLICTLGISPAVVLEAIFANGNDNPYLRVFCITPDGNQKNIQTIRKELGRVHRCKVDFSVFIVKGFYDLSDQAGHALFQDAQYDHYLRCIEGKSPEQVHVCISGGYKTMTAALQKAAHLFGAGRVFHVVADQMEAPAEKTGPCYPVTLEDVIKGYEKGQIRAIDLGPEPGRSFVTRNAAELRKIKSKSDFIDSLLAKADAVSENIDRFDALPFSSLTGLDPARLNRLDTPLSDWLDSKVIEQLPKIELHCHLGGFATHGDVLREVRAAARYPEKLPELSEPVFPENWPNPESPVHLNAYRNLGDATGSTILSDPGCLNKHVTLLYRHLQEQRVAYAEVRCSPNNYTRLGHSALEMLDFIRQAFNQQMDQARTEGQWYTRVNLIIIVTRKKSGDLSAISRHLALAVTAFDPGAGIDSCQVVGVDLAGFEDRDTRPQYFQTDFDLAHRTGLAVTAHAGENDDVESIWQAVFKLNARRLGHALNLSDARDLMRAVSDRGIGIEMCPFANYQIAGFHPMAGKRSYPLLDYLESGIKVTVNTDNIGISQASLSDNIRLLAKMLPEITLLQVLQLQRNALDVTFAGDAQKKSVAKQMNLKVFEVLMQCLNL